MKKYFVIAAICAGVCAGAYWAGGRVATAQCDVKISEIRMAHQSTNAEILGAVHEKTVNTGVRDIRRILHEKYTMTGALSAMIWREIFTGIIYCARRCVISRVMRPVQCQPIC